MLLGLPGKVREYRSPGPSSETISSSHHAVSFRRRRSPAGEGRGRGCGDPVGAWEKGKNLSPGTGLAAKRTRGCGQSSQRGTPSSCAARGWLPARRITSTLSGPTQKLGRSVGDSGPVSHSPARQWELCTHHPEGVAGVLWVQGWRRCSLTKQTPAPVQS